MASKRKSHGTNSIHLDLFAPDSNWRPPEYFPELKDCKYISIDTESRDPHLKTHGPGGVRNDGETVGFSICTDTGYCGYFPYGHLGGGNLSKSACLSWLQETLNNNRDASFVGANTIYDLEWLRAEGITVNNAILDVQILEGLLDEEGRYSLEHLSNKYLNSHKEEAMLTYAAQTFGIDPKRDLWKLHSKYVGEYGEVDARNPLLILEKQLPLIKAENLEAIAALEHKLIPIILEMRFKGVRIDLEKAHQLNNRMRADCNTIITKLRDATGLKQFNIWSQPDIEKICKLENIEPGRTAAGNLSFTKEWLDEQDTPLLQSIKQARTLDRMAGTFVEEKIIKFSVNGRIHAQFHQMRGDEDGTRTGRFSSSNPNLQQVPSRNELAKYIRGLFIPEPGELWCKLDYSQQEPRITTHFGLVCCYRGADKVREDYIRGIDFYDFVVREAECIRRQAKDLTLGRTYGMGIKKMADKLHCSIEKATDILNRFDESVPYIKKLADATSRAAMRRGYITTLGGRRRHFNLYTPAGTWGETPVSLEVAENRWPGLKLQRFGVHKALNSLIQGSAADMTKMAMVKCYEEHGQIPLMQVHDELNFSIPDEETGLKLKDACETALPLLLPVVCDMDLGDSWK